MQLCPSYYCNLCGEKCLQYVKMLVNIHNLFMKDHSNLAYQNEIKYLNFNNE